MPAQGPLSSNFGLRRVINGQPRSPHSGIDIAAPAGAPVTAPAPGRVLRVGDYFFTGNTVFVDHGQGLVTLSATLSSVAVREGAAAGDRRRHRRGRQHRSGHRAAPALGVEPERRARRPAAVPERRNPGRALRPTLDHDTRGPTHERHGTGHRRHFRQAAADRRRQPRHRSGAGGARRPVGRAGAPDRAQRAGGDAKPRPRWRPSTAHRSPVTGSTSPPPTPPRGWTPCWTPPAPWTRSSTTPA